ncbi:type I toxin-antitoxin system Fst family toxin [Salinicoccus roseus]|nr:type I toxin-antitoxin system Fst family toxin [Salinicoccus roseus]
MFATMFEFLIAPIVVGAVITLYSYWLDNRED